MLAWNSTLAAAVLGAAMVTVEPAGAVVAPSKKSEKAAPAPEKKGKSEGNYGVIAYSEESDITGWATDFPSEAEAEKGALGACKNEGGKKCKAVLWFADNCGSFAVGDGQGYQSAYADTKEAADAEALKGCEKLTDNCVIRESICNAQ
jgi:hypothetical protein